MPLVALVAGLLLVLLGTLLCALTDRIERLWDTRRSPIIPARPALPAIPPFLTSLDQCIDCGNNKDPYGDPLLLNLDRRCLGCHEFHHLSRPA